MSGEERLYLFAESYVKQRGFRFDQGAESGIRILANEAVKELENKFLESYDQARMEESFLQMVEQIFSFFIDAMILARERLYDNRQLQNNILGEDTYQKARSWICPLWPICV